MDRRVAYLTENQKIELRTVPMKEITEDEVLVRIKAVGVCGSDVSYYLRGSSGMGHVTYPHILGHECGGIIERVGSNVEDYEVGDRVAIEPGVPCGKCTYCRSGRYNLCEDLSFMSTAIVRPYGEGGMAEYVIRPAKMLHKIPESVSYEQAAMIEPLSVAMHAAKIGDVKMGQSTAIIGCGPIAGCLLQTLRGAGVGTVYMTDMIEYRLNRMKELGATETFNVSGVTGKDLYNLLPEKVDAVFDTTCIESAINASFRWMKKGGTFVMVGVPAAEKTIDMNAAFVREIAIRTTFRYENTYPTAIAMIANGKIAPEELITHRYPIEEADVALKLASERRGDVLKVMIDL